MKGRALAILSLACWALTGSPAAADTEAEKAIRDALTRWTADFNARDASRICDLFAADLRYDFRGTPERDYDAMCSALHRALGDRQAHRARDAVLLERRDIAVRCSRLHKAVFVRLVPHVLAAAEARHVAQYVGVFGSVPIKCLDDFGRTRQEPRIVGRHLQRRKIRLRMWRNPGSTLARG